MNFIAMITTKKTAALVRAPQGFTLLEMGVAMGIGSLLILSVAQYSLFSARTQKSQNMTAEFNQVIGSVGQALGDETHCTSLLSGQLISPMPSPTGSLPSLVARAPNGATQTLVSTTALPSGLTFSSITIGNPRVTGTSGAYTQEMIDITLTASKPNPAPSPSSTSQSVNPSWVGGSAPMTKKFTVSVWALGANVNKCMSSQDMAQGAPYVPTPYPSGAILTCAGNAPTCPGAGSGNAQCCRTTQSPVPYWTCPTAGWSCSS